MAQRIVQLAPMLGLIDAPFMNALAKIGGFDEYVAPYIVADSNSLTRPAVLRRRFADMDKSVNLVPQLLCNNASAFVHFANAFFDIGYTKINWNMGCPQPFVTKRGRGAAMLKNIQHTSALLEQVLQQLKPSLSVKIRLGYSSKDEFMPLIEMFNQFDLDELIVHARTAEQQYEGLADKHYFLSGVEFSKNKLIYNGDIWQLSDIDIFRNHAIKGYMIGRGVLKNPFIGLQIKGMPYDWNDFRQFCMEVSSWYLKRGTSGCMNRLKELWQHLSQAFVESDAVFEKIKPISNVQNFETVVTQIFERYRLAAI